MGDPKKPRKKYFIPSHLWEKSRLEVEVELIKKYGLRNKRELWRFEAYLRKYRRVARELLGKIDLPGREGEKARAQGKSVLNKLYRMGVVEENATLDDVLGLTVEAFLERRLQTLVYRLGLANTIKQARQFIVHGHIAVDGRRMNSPGYIVTRDKESTITFYQNSPIKDMELQKVKVEE